MVKRVGGFRRRTRHIMMKSRVLRGKISLTRFFTEFKSGDQVVLNAEPAYQKGMYFRRFHGRIGVVGKKKGRCYEVAVKDGTLTKTFVVHPVHLKKA